MTFDEVKLKFTEGALVGIARKAYKQKTGARGLRAILELTMLDVMFDIPSQPDVKEVLITEEVIQGKAEPIKVFERQKNVKPAIGS